MMMMTTSNHNDNEENNPRMLLHPQAVKSVAADRAARHREHSMATGTILAPAEGAEHHLETYQIPADGSAVPPGYEEGPGLPHLCQPQQFLALVYPSGRLTIQKASAPSVCP